jgi:hypothetical protein
MRVVNRLTRLLVSAVGDLGVVSVQNPVTLPPHSEPQPDFAILRPGFDRLPGGLPHHDDVLLLIEVADTTLAYDRSKLRLYARHGIREIWIVNLTGARARDLPRAGGRSVSREARALGGRHRVAAGAAYRRRGVERTFRWLIATGPLWLSRRLSGS